MPALMSTTSMLRRLLSVLFITASCGAHVASADATLFPRLKAVKQVDGLALRMALGSKFGIRALFQGGPISQPTFFKHILPVPRAEDRFRTHDNPGKAIHLLSTDDQEWTIEKLVTSILQKEVHLPLVYKANRGALGHHIVFFEETSDAKIKITFAADRHLRKYTEHRLAYFKGQGVSDVTQGLDTVSVVLDRSHPEGANILSTVIKEFADSQGAGGIVETKELFFTVDGGAYETRHFFSGSVKTGRSVLLKAKSLESKGWFARIGNSPYFSNLTGREGITRVIGYPEMFEPLFQHFKIYGEDQKRFLNYVDDTIQDQFRFMSERLHEAGLGIDGVITSEFDLMWSPEADPQTGFPKPFLIESSFDRGDFLPKKKKILLTQSPFPRLPMKKEISAKVLDHALATKYATRTLLRNGPIAQPPFVKRILWNKDPTAPPARTEEIDIQVNQMLHAISLPEDEMTLEALVDAIHTQSIELPLVYKANYSAFGYEVLFIEKLEDQIKLTFSADTAQGFYTDEAISFLERHGGKTAYIRDHTATVLLDLQHPQFKEALHGTLSIAMNNRNSGGIVEPLVSFFKPGGKALETRHSFKGSILTGDCELVRPYSNESEGWYTRIGTSSYYSNASGRPTAQVLFYNQMFDSLFAHFEIRPDEQKTFLNYVDDLIKKEFRYLAQRLRNAGLAFDLTFHGEFDLMWSETKNAITGFPEPMLIEANFNKRSAFARYETLVPHPTHPCAKAL